MCTCSTCGTPQPSSNVSPYTFANFNTLTKSVVVTGAAVAKVFPLAVKVAELNFKTNAGVFAFALTSSLTVPVAGQAGFFVALDQGDTVSVDGLTKLFLSHLSNQNSIPGVPNPSSRSNALQMGQRTYFPVPSGQKVALYASAPNDATVILSCDVTALWIPVS